MEEKQIIINAKAGCQKAFTALYNRCYGPVFSHILKMSRGNTGIAEDITIVALEKAFRKIDTFSPEKPFVSWVFRIARNAFLDNQRLSRNRLNPSSLDLEYGKAGPLHLIIPDSTPTIDNQLIKREQQQLVRDAVCCLPEVSRAYISMRFFEGLTYPQISELKGEPKGSTSSGVLKGKRLVKKHYLRLKKAIEI